MIDKILKATHLMQICNLATWEGVIEFTNTFVKNKQIKYK